MKTTTLKTRKSLWIANPRLHTSHTQLLRPLDGRPSACGGRRKTSDKCSSVGSLPIAPLWLQISQGKAQKLPLSPCSDGASKRMYIL